MLRLLLPLRQMFSPYRSNMQSPSTGRRSKGVSGGISDREVDGGLSGVRTLDLRIRSPMFF